MGSIFHYNVTYQNGQSNLASCQPHLNFPNKLPARQKTKFTPYEDHIILMHVQQNGSADNWPAVAKLLPDRTPRQIRERYVNYLSPKVNRTPFTPEEDELLLKLVSEHGTSWSKICTHFTNRTDVALKNHYNLLKRRKKKQQSIEDVGAPEFTCSSVNLPQFPSNWTNSDFEATDQLLTTQIDHSDNSDLQGNGFQSSILADEFLFSNFVSDTEEFPIFDPEQPWNELE